MKISTETGVRITVCLILFCIALFIYLFYSGVIQQMRGGQAKNLSCDTSEAQIAGYCQKI